MEPVFKLKNWWRGEWELWHREQVVATLTLKNWSYSLAEIHIGDARWEVGYTGWTGNKLFLRSAAGENVATNASGKWFSYDVDIVLEGVTYSLRRNGWHTRFFATDESGAEIVRIKPRWWKGGAEITTTRSMEDKTVLLLSCVLFYQYKLTEMHAAASGA